MTLPRWIVGGPKLREIGLNNIAIKDISNNAAITEYSRALKDTDIRQNRWRVAGQNSPPLYCMLIFGGYAGGYCNGMLYEKNAGTKKCGYQNMRVPKCMMDFLQFFLWHPHFFMVPAFRTRIFFEKDCTPLQLVGSWL